MNHIKERRLRLPVTCHKGTCVGDYVPFYFCPRSLMLYVIHKANDGELTYRGGQEPIVHLEADLHRVISWADSAGRRWAFSLSNAGAFYAPFRSEVARLDEVNWQAVAAVDFRSADIRHGKQAEFLVHESFPWQLVQRIGVTSRSVAAQVVSMMRSAEPRPSVEVRPGWYY
jgi:ssDNA thymidine ADP-ribosyltransferase, DarT